MKQESPWKNLWSSSEEEECSEIKFQLGFWWREERKEEKLKRSWKKERNEKVKRESWFLYCFSDMGEFFDLKWPVINVERCRQNEIRSHDY